MEAKYRARRRKTNLDFISCTRRFSSTNARITNLSVTGAYIETSRPLPVDTELDLHLQLPNDTEVISIDACVVRTTPLFWHDTTGMGVHFTKILAKHRKKLLSFID
jgi:c-di-GMP-binding flagellar brake protein YcgR